MVSKVLILYEYDYIIEICHLCDSNLKLLLPLWSVREKATFLGERPFIQMWKINLLFVTFPCENVFTPNYRND